VSTLNINMLELITWEDILLIWKNELWPDRISPIEATSAMCYLNDYDMDNMLTTPSFFGYIVDNKIVGVNSGHSCPKSKSYRSRGLWVHPDHRGRGIGQQLLKATIAKGFDEGNTMVWSYPRKTSWNTYAAVGFSLDTEWKKSETSEQNAFCSLHQKI
jgi:GNAT superfamily N-acetyltransferase